MEGQRRTNNCALKLYTFQVKNVETTGRTLPTGLSLFNGGKERIAYKRNLCGGLCWTSIKMLCENKIINRNLFPLFRQMSTYV